ncbi:MAG TPA: NADH-quinone oxidoreductase subunit NuoG [Nevskiaceae bacterium]|nr:NADH-quinone oxidoreductase subunit NuoG [Nevskiaceae bacterium]
MAIIHVEGKQYEVNGADNLLQACLSLGLDIPYFCWHPALGSVGACRQCAVKQYRDADDKMGRIVMSCMTPASQGTFISIADEEAKAFRESVVEFLMTNHPHDCPVCEEGGHCHLQDMTVMTGHHSRSYRFDKRTHLNQDLGPFIGHEMNRCISCYRCVRYYKDYAGGTDLGVYGAAANVYFGRPQSGTLESEFSGNLTEVCPTGVFTDKTHSERYTRKWDMQFAPSLCAGCAVGCNVSPGERYGEIRRVENRYHGEINGYFLCDRGRFGYGYTNAKDRPRQAQVNGQLLEPAAALEALRGQLTGQRVIGIGSPRASVEANHALLSWVGEARFYEGQSSLQRQLTHTVLRLLREGPLGNASLSEIEACDAVIVLGEDPTATAPRVALAIRQAARGRLASEGAKKNIGEWQVIALADLVQQDRNPVILATPDATRLDDIAAETLHGSPEQLAVLAQAIAHAVDPAVPAVSGLDAESQTLASRLAALLAAAKAPLVVSGTAAGSVALLEAAANLAWALQARNPATRMVLSVPEVNSLGLALLPSAGAVDEALAALAAGEADALVVLETDLYRHAAAERVEAALAAAKAVVVIDHSATATSARASALLPAATVFESDGSFVNYEGRAQRHFQVFDPTYYNAAHQQTDAWRWLSALAGEPVQQLDGLTARAAAAIPALAGITDAAPAASFRIKGLKVSRSPHRASGRTAMRAHLSVHEPRQPQDADAALNFSMEGYNGVGSADRPPSLLPFAWSPGWNSPQAWNKFQAEVGGALRGGDPGVALLQPAARAPAYAAAPRLESARGLRLLNLPVHFGAEELSSRAEPIRKRSAPAQLSLHPEDARRLGVNGHARIEIGGVSARLPTRLSAALPQGWVGLPAGAPGVPYFTAGAVITVSGD